MEKIVKLEGFNWVSGRDAITIALCNIIIRKQNEIIDYLNSQSQPEENNFVHTVGTPMLESTTTCSQDTPEKELTDKKKDVDKGVDNKDTPEEWICPKCGFDDCYPYKNSEDFRLMYCPACSELVKLNSKKK